MKFVGRERRKYDINPFNDYFMDEDKREIPSIYEDPFFVILKDISQIYMKISRDKNINPTEKEQALAKLFYVRMMHLRSENYIIKEDVEFLSTYDFLKIFYGIAFEVLYYNHVELPRKIIKTRNNFKESIKELENEKLALERSDQDSSMIITTLSTMKNSLKNSENQEKFFNTFLGELSERKDVDLLQELLSHFPENQEKFVSEALEIGTNQRDQLLNVFEHEVVYVNIADK